jgi:hypothetical protein
MSMLWLWAAELVTLQTAQVYVGPTTFRQTFGELGDELVNKRCTHGLLKLFFELLF